MRFWWDREWDAATQGFARAQSLAPGAATVHHWHGNALLAMGRADEALAQLREAQRLDPLSFIVGTELGAACYQARRPQEATAHLRAVLELEPSFATARFWLGRVLLQRGQVDDALQEYRQARALVGTPESMLAELGYACARAGRESEARRYLARLEALADTRPVACSRAIVHAGLGENQRALDLLERAFEERVTDLAFIGTDPVFDGLRGEARFAALQRRLRTPRSAGAAS